ncbi:MAG: hypothetical protein IT169_14445 [Bryobacterales bacterium]|nr:hypothetical protein [Bryobacterales bacterium]
MSMPAFDETHSPARYPSRRWILKCIPAVAVFAAACRQARAAPAHSEAAATHNMLLTGTKTAFLSHLPMFEALTSDGRAYASPHRYQVILEVSFKKNATDATPLYVREREKRPGSALYTFQPVPFVLTGLKQDDTATEVTSLRGTVFRGHLERGGEPVPELSDVEAHITRVVHFREFDPATRRQQHLEYILFGRGEETFAAHVISKPPDFDQILPVIVSTTPRHRELLQGGTRVSVQGRADAAKDRLRKADVAKVAVSASRGPVFEVEARPEIYFEEGELMIPPTFETTTEEERSGF